MADKVERNTFGFEAINNLSAERRPCNLIRIMHFYKGDNACRDDFLTNCTPKRYCQRTSRCNLKQI